MNRYKKRKCRDGRVETFEILQWDREWIQMEEPFVGLPLVCNEGILRRMSSKPALRTWQPDYVNPNYPCFDHRGHQ